MTAFPDLNALDSLFNLLNRIPELIPGLTIPGIESVNVAVWILAGLLAIWLIRLITLEI